MILVVLLVLLERLFGQCSGRRAGEMRPSSVYSFAQWIH